MVVAAEIVVVNQSLCLQTLGLHSAVGLPLAWEETNFLQLSSVAEEAGGTAAAVVAPRRFLPVEGVPCGVDLQAPLARVRLGMLDRSGTGGFRCPLESLAVAAVADGAAAAGGAAAVDAAAVGGVGGGVAADVAAVGDAQGPQEEKCFQIGHVGAAAAAVDAAAVGAEADVVAAAAVTATCVAQNLEVPWL